MGSGGKRVCKRPSFFPAFRSASTICSIKFRLFLSFAAITLLSSIFFQYSFWSVKVLLFFACPSLDHRFEVKNSPIGKRAVLRHGFAPRAMGLPSPSWDRPTARSAVHFTFYVLRSPRGDERQKAAPLCGALLAREPTPFVTKADSGLSVRR